CRVPGLPARAPDSAPKVERGPARAWRPARGLRDTWQRAGRAPSDSAGYGRADSKGLRREIRARPGDRVAPRCPRQTVAATSVMQRSVARARDIRRRSRTAAGKRLLPRRAVARAPA